MNRQAYLCRSRGDADRPGFFILVLGDILEINRDELQEKHGLFGFIGHLFGMFT